MKKIIMMVCAMATCNAYGENVYWSNNDSLHSTTSCTSGNNITKPADPTKNGYRFIGWKELTEPTNWKQMIYFPFKSHTPTSNGTSATTWTTTGNYGSLEGSWRCSSTSGSTPSSCTSDGIGCTTNSNPSTSGTTKYCWCKGTKATFNGSTTNMSSSLAWVFFFSNTSASDCANTCANACAYNIRASFGRRRAVFGVTQ